jgi:hypothetical protein
MMYIPEYSGRASTRPRGTGRFPSDLEVKPRKIWLRDFGKDHAPGKHHITKLGPTGRGKSTLSGQMLGEVASPDYQAVVLHGKIFGRDKVILKMADERNLRIVHTWPPPPPFRHPVTHRAKNINGWILIPLEHPQPTVAEENIILQREFRKAIHDNYTRTGKSPRITHVDESHQAQETLKLREDLEGPLMRGAPDNSEWNNLQRGRYVSYHCYSAPEDIIIFYDPDESNQKRYAEIGDVNKDEIIDITSNLRTETAADGRTISQALHIKRAGPAMCIVDT